MDTLAQTHYASSGTSQIHLIEQKRLRLLHEKGFKGAKRAHKGEGGAQRALFYLMSNMLKVLGELLHYPRYEALTQKLKVSHTARDK